MNPEGNTQFAGIAKDTYQAVQSTVDILPAGYYEIKSTQSGYVFRRQDLRTDNIVNFEDALGASIITEIAKFWEQAPKFKEFGFLHRRGYLLHGPPGSGKTSLIQLIVADTIARNGIIFTCNSPDSLEEGLKIFRGIEPTRNVVCLFEDIDSIIDYHGDEELLALLDGENQINHVLNIATTNYLTKLDKRIVARPRRFDRLFEIGMPNDKVRAAYLGYKFPMLSDTEVKVWIKSTKGFSFAAMADLAISIKCLDIPFETAVKTLKEMLKLDKTSYSEVV